MKHHLSQALLIISVCLAALLLSQVGAYDTPGIALDVTIAGSYAYVADHDSGAVTLISRRSL